MNYGGRNYAHYLNYYIEPFEKIFYKSIGDVNSYYANPYNINGGVFDDDDRDNYVLHTKHVLQSQTKRIRDLEDEIQTQQAKLHESNSALVQKTVELQQALHALQSLQSLQAKEVEQDAEDVEEAEDIVVIKKI